MGNEIDGAVDVVEFVEQPIAIVVHGCPQPAGDGEPKPGGESKTMLVMSRVECSVTRGDQMALLSGMPWPKTLVLWA